MMMAEVLKIPNNTVHILQNAQKNSDKMVDKKQTIYRPSFSYSFTRCENLSVSCIQLFIQYTQKVFQTPKLPFLATEWIEPFLF